MKGRGGREEKPLVEQVHSAMNSFGTHSNEECWWGIQAGGVSWAKSGVCETRQGLFSWLHTHSVLTHPHSQIKKLTQNIPCSQSRMSQMFKYLDSKNNHDNALAACI